MDVGHVRLRGLLALGVFALAIGYWLPSVAGGPGQQAGLIFPGRVVSERLPVIDSPESLLTSPDVTLAVREVQYIPGPPADIPAPPRSLPAAVRTQVVQVTVEVPFKTTEVEDSSLPVGSSRVDSPGSPGSATVVKEVSFRGGRQVDERTVRTEISQPPQDRVVRVGSRAAALPMDGSFQVKQSIAGSSTSYCLTGTTATGTPAGPGAIAVDPNVIRLGSHLYVTGYGFGYATDTGGAIRGTLVDLWKTCDMAIQWGRRPVTIYVLDR